jgi:hypothetical protein
VRLFGSPERNLAADGRGEDAAQPGVALAGPDDPDWNNSTVLKADVVNNVSKLKQGLDDEIVVADSF